MEGVRHRRNRVSHGLENVLTAFPGEGTFLLLLEGEKEFPANRRAEGRGPPGGQGGR